MNNTPWDIDKARELYNIDQWSEGYFRLADNGCLQACPRGPDSEAGVDMYRLSRDLIEQNLHLPVLVRFSNILHHRVDCLAEAFARAMRQEEYSAGYTAVYPIKVNQQRHVVQEILRHGGSRVGLEAGSKPELLAVLALAPPENGLIICNGYKDSEYIRLALIGQYLGVRPYLVIEKSSEVKIIIEQARLLNITPRLGVRVRLASIGAGKWQNTGGEKAKFGLSSAQVLEVIGQLRQAGLLDALRLMHFHIGSQVANIRDVHGALREAARYYAQLRRLGAPLRYVDVGGGLGVDYEGARSRNSCSMNYSLQEYANNVIYAFHEICREHGLPHPDIITESGRAMTAHHAVLLVNVTDVEAAPGREWPEAARPGEPQIIQDLWYGLANLTPRTAQEAYHDAAYWLGEAHAMFTHGLLSLPERARAEQLYFATCWRVRELLLPTSRHHRELLDELDDKLADKYFCNFSLFQSVPDAWAIDQLFPILPLHRLREMPDRRATLQDLTCDSDGRLDYYVESTGMGSSLPVHGLKAGEDYVLGIFLVGAYQEILGDMHNLFGDTHAVNVELTEKGGYRLVEPEYGDSVADMLNYVHFDADNLKQRYTERLAQASGLNAAQRQSYLEELQAGLRGYTYLE